LFFAWGSMAMTCRPFMPLFVGDYLGDTRELTRSEHGGYLLLLMEYWIRGGPLPDDDRVLQRITLCDRASTWQRLRRKLQHFFTICGGKWQHKRADFELAKIKHKKDLDARRTPDSRARVPEPDPEESSPSGTTSSREEAPIPAEGRARAAPPGREALSLEASASAGGKEESLITVGCRVLRDRKAASFVGKMLKLHGSGRVTLAIERTAAANPDRSGRGFFRAICEGREAKPPPEQSPRRAEPTPEEHEAGRLAYLASLRAEGFVLPEAA